jgi:hypothetical protein
MVDKYTISNQVFMDVEYPVNTTAPTVQVPHNVMKPVTTTSTRGLVLVLYIILITLFLVLVICEVKSMCKKAKTTSRDTADSN